MVKLVPHDVRFFATTSALREWFDANHETAEELWLGYYKKGSGMPSVTWTEAVDEALCVGWIDGVLQRIDERSHAQRFTPRRKGSNWSAINVAKVATLTEQRPDATGRDTRVRGSHGRQDGRLLVRARDGGSDRRRAHPVPRRARSVVVLGSPSRLVPEGGPALGDEREAGGHTRAAARHAHRGLEGSPNGQAADTTAGRHVTTSDPATTSEEVLAEAVRRLVALDLGDAFERAAAEAIVATGLHRLVVPAAAGGLGGRMVEAAEALLAIAAVDGSTALGFAMQLHVIGALVDGDAVPTSIRDRLFARVLSHGALVNNAATEEGGGSPARGAIPGTVAQPAPTARGG